MKKYMLGVTAIVLAVLASAFTVNKPKISKAEMNKRVDIQTWHFTGAVLADDKSEANYDTGAGDSCDNIVEVPCTISFDADDFSTPSTNTPLQNYLNSKTDAQIRDDADSKRSE